MKTEKEFKKWIEKQIKYYKPYLDINLQDITVIKGKNTKYMEITTTYPYLEPVIKYSDSALNQWKSGILKKDIILHELCHILTDPLYNKSLSRFVGENEIEDEREKLTDTITVILNNLIK